MTTARFGADGIASYSTGVVAATPSLRRDGLSSASLELDAGALLWGTDFSAIRDATVVSATFNAVLSEAVTGTADLTLTANDTAFSTDATWFTRPGTVGTDTTETVSSPAAGDVVQWDVTALVQDGATNGWQVTRSDAGAAVKVALADSWVDVEFEFKGAKADGLSPHGVVGVTKPLLSGFPKNTTAVRVQIDLASDGFGAPDWESDTVFVDKPQLDLSTTDFPGLGVSAQWWRVSTKSSGSDWSDYSDPIRMQYVALPTVEILAPNDTFPYVTDTSPTIPWTVTGQTQAQYRVRLTSVGDGDKTQLWTSGRITGTEHQVTIPAKDPDTGRLILKDRNQYRVWVQVWDDVEDRVAVPGADVFQQAAQVFTFTEVPGVPPFDYLVAEQVSTSPMVRLDFGRLAGVPDHVQVWWDDELHDVVEPEDLIDDGAGGFSYFIWNATPNTPHTIYVQAVVNGSTSNASPSAVITVEVEGVWLQNKRLDVQVPLVNVDWGLSVTDQASTSQALGQRNKTRRTDAVGYLEGSLSGVIAADPFTGRAATDIQRDMTVIKANPAEGCTVFFNNKSFDAIVSNVAFGPDDSPQGLADVFRTRVSMYVEQQDDLTTATEPPPASDPVYPDPARVYTYSEFANNHAFIVGDADIDAEAGTPTVHSSPVVHTDGEKSWSGGSITRSLPNSIAGTRSVYALISTATMSNSSSALNLKHGPGDPEPLDVRIRTKGSIDIHGPDGTIWDTLGLEWQKDIPFRVDVAWQWTADASLGAGMGYLEVWVWVYFGVHVESPTPDDIMHAYYPSLEPVTGARGTPSSTVNFEVDREWDTALQPPPYGDLPPIPDIPAGYGLHVGYVDNDEAYVSVYAGDAEPGDTVGLYRSTSSDMSSPTSVGSSVRGTYGWNRFHITTGLAANTNYWYQQTVNGTAVGPICKGRTMVAAGTAATLRLAGLGCQRTTPSSPAVFEDIVDWAGSTTVHGAIHHGDDGYCNDLDDTQASHQKWYSYAATDPGRSILNTIGAVLPRRSDHDTNQNNLTAPKGNNPNFADPTSYTSLQAWDAVKPVPNDDVRTKSLTVGGSWFTWKVANYVFFFADTRSQERTNVWTLPRYVDGGYDPRRDPASTMLGTTQLTALKAAIDFASLNDRLFILVSDPGWMGEAEIDEDTGKIIISNSDKWVSYIVERDAIEAYMVASYTAQGKTTNCMIMHGDTHAVQYGYTATGSVLVVGVGAADQEPHALQTFIDNYDWTWPDGLGSPGHRPKRQMYYRHVFTETAGVVTYTGTPRNCSPAIVGDTPVDLTDGIVTESWTL